MSDDTNRDSRSVEDNQAGFRIAGANGGEQSTGRMGCENARETQGDERLVGTRADGWLPRAELGA